MVVTIASGLAALILAFLVVVPTIRYRLTKSRLVISLLGVPVRWVSLKNIRYITDFTKDFAEPWPNTHNSLGRQLYIRKRHGLFHTLLITPQKRFVFKAEIERAIRELDPRASFEDTAFHARPSSKNSIHSAA